MYSPRDPQKIRMEAQEAFVLQHYNKLSATQAVAPAREKLRTRSTAYIVQRHRQCYVFGIDVPLNLAGLTSLTRSYGRIVHILA
jgi:hypothetical protein